jgi:hypothetical protein
MRANSLTKETRSEGIFAGHVDRKENLLSKSFDFSMLLVVDVSAVVRLCQLF